VIVQECCSIIPGVGRARQVIDMALTHVSTTSMRLEHILWGNFTLAQKAYNLVRFQPTKLGSCEFFLTCTGHFTRQSIFTNAD